MDKLFKKALLVSLLIHLVIFLRLPNIDLEQKEQKELKPLKVNYIKIAPKKIFTEETLVKNKNMIQSKSLVQTNKNVNQIDLKSERFNVSQTNLSKPIKSLDNAKTLSKSVSLAEIENIQENLPGYKDYYHSIRSKIKKAAYDNYSVSDVGEIHIYFIVKNDGTLVDFRIKDSLSSDSASLRNIAILSLQDASPFPNFPKELTTEILSFNVIISFESR